MPIDSPAGFLYTLEETVLAARDERDHLEVKYKSPVLLVVAPQEGWAEITAVRTTTEGSNSQPIPTPPSVTMMPTLVIPVVKSLARSTGSNDITFGRSTICDVVLPFAAISKAHGFFREEAEGRWQVSDLGSKNGTYVDGQKVLPQTTMNCRDGATLRLGDVTVKFYSPVSFIADLRRRF